MAEEINSKNSSKDYLHATVKGAFAAIPFAGGIVSELFGIAITSPVEKRKENILIMIDERLNQIESKVNGFKIEKLIENEVFLSTTLQASQIALRTHQRDKLASLVNAVTNAAINNIDENLQQMFLSFIDSFNEWHLRILLFLSDPSLALAEKGLASNHSAGSVGSILYLYFPELRGRKEFVKQIFNDLYSRGLLNTDAGILNTMMTGSGMVAPRTSMLGNEFLKFIKLPEQFN